MSEIIQSLRREWRVHPWLWRGVVLTGAAAFGSALTDIVAFVLS